MPGQGSLKAWGTSSTCSQDNLALELRETPQRPLGPPAFLLLIVQVQDRTLGL